MRAIRVPARRVQGPGILPVLAERARVNGTTLAEEERRREAEAWERLATTAELYLARSGRDLEAIRRRVTS